MTLSGSTVTRWNDKSGNGYNTSSIVGTPTFSEGKGVVFNGSSYFNLPNSSIPFGNSSYSIFIVATFNNGGAYNGLLTAGTAGNSQCISIVSLLDNKIRLYWYNSDIDTTGTFTAGTRFIYDSSYESGGQRTAFINGTLSASNTPSARNQPNTGNKIGITLNGEILNGSISEILVFNTSLTNTQRQTVQGYLANKWGLQQNLPANHPSYGPPTPLVLLKAVNYSGSGAWLDESGSGRNATKENGVIAKNTAGNGIVLNGSTSWSFPNVAVGNSFSAGVWFKLTVRPTNEWPGILTQIISNQVGNLMIGGQDPINASFFNVSWRPGNNFSLPLGQWTNIQFTWNGTNFSTYINGVSIGTTQPGGTAVDSGQRYLIGRDWNNVAYVRGEIGEVRIYGTPLTQAQVTADYTESVGTFIKPLVLLKAVNYSGSGAWLDESGSGRNATLETGVIAKNTAGNGIVLNGSTNWRFPNVSAGNAWTVSVWFKKTGTPVGSYASIITQMQGLDDNPSSTANVNLAITHWGGTSIVSGTFFNGAWRSSTNNYTLVSGQWVNIQITWNGTNMITYINGVLLGSNAPGGTSLDGGTPYRIGRRWATGDYMVGEIGEVRIYNVPITHAQVKADYNSSYSNYFTPSTFIPTTIPGCQLWLDAKDPLATGTEPANGTGITTWSDKSGNARNGTANSAITYNSTALGGYPTLTFPGNRWFLGSTSVTGPGITVFAIASITNGGGIAGRIIGTSTGAGVYDFNSSLSMALMRSGSGMQSCRNNLFTSVTATSYATPYLFGSWADGTNLNNTAQIGNSTTIGTLAGTGNFGITSYGIGSGTNPSDGNGLFNGNISEVIVYNRTLSTVERQAVEGHLSWKWGLQANLPSTHPYYSGPPTVPTTPTTIIPTISNITPTSFVASWTGAVGATSYTFTLNGSSATPSTNNALASKTVTFTGLTHTTNYSLGIVATNDAGSTPVTTSTTTLIPFPTAPVVTLSSIRDTSVVASWTGAVGATSYTYTLNGVTVTPSTDNGVSSKTATFTGLNAATSYTVGVNATNSTGPTPGTATATTLITSLKGVGAPSNSLSGVSNNTYIDTSTGDVYKYVGASGMVSDFTVSGSGINRPFGIASDPSGNLYIADYANFVWRKVDTSGVLTTFAGIVGQANTNPSTISGLATSIKFWTARGVARDSVGNTYLADENNRCVFKVNTSGIVSLFAGGRVDGNGNAISGSANGAALTVASFQGPIRLTCDASDNLYMIDGNMVRKVSNGVVSTLSTTSQIQSPSGLVCDAAGNLYVTQDTGGSNGISKIDTAGNITVFAGSGSGYLDGTKLTAKFNGPMGITIDSSGNFYVADTGNNRIRKIDTSGNVTTLAGSGSLASTNGAGTAAAFNKPYDITLTKGDLYVIDYNSNMVRKVLLNSWSLRSTGVTAITIVGAPSTSLTASVNQISIDTTNGDVYTYVGPIGTVSNFTASGSGINRPFGMTSDESGNLYIADYNNSVWRKVDTSGVLTTFAGIVGQQNTNPSTISGVATSIKFWTPRGVARDSLGNTYLADENNRCIFKVDTSGNVALFAGGTVNVNGGAISGTTNGPALSATFMGPIRLACDVSNNLYVIDGNMVRKVSNGVVSTIATNAQLSWPAGLCVDPSGNVYVTENNATHGIRKIDPSGNITAFAGSGSGYLDGDRLTAKFNGPEGITIDASGNLYIADTGNNRIRKIDTDGNVTTLAGNGTASNINAVGTSATFNKPYDITLTKGDLYVADFNTNLVRKVLLNPWTFTAASVMNVLPLPTTIFPTISNITPTSFVAAWSGAVGTISYTFTLNGSDVTPSIDNALSGKTVTFTGLTHTTNYTLVIVATNSFGSTPVTTSTTTLIPFPTAPVVTVTNLKDTTFTVSYTSTGTSYSYTLNGSPVTPSVSGLTATFSGLTASTNYSLVVNAINSTGPTPTTTAITTMPPPPTVPVVSATSITDTSFVASWTGGVGASSYTYTLNGTAATPSTDDGLASKSITFTGLTSSTSYTLVVTAINSTNPTNSIGTTVNTLIPRPTVPVVTIGSVRDTTFVASWTGGATATSYSYTLNGTPATPSINNALASQTVTFTGLQASTDYTLVVTASNGTGPTVSTGVSTTTLIAPPSLPVVTVGSIRDTSFVATWTGGLRATSYTYTLNGSSVTPSTDAGLTSQSATFTGLNAATTYTLIVTAINSTNPTTSAGVSMNTLIPPPTKPDSLNITSITNTSFVANWTGGDPATSYTYTLNGLAVTPAIDNGVNSDNATFTGLQPSTTYTLLVTAIGSTGPTISDPITVTTLPPLPTVPVVTIGTISDTYFMVTWTGGVGATSYTYTLNGNDVTADVDDCLCGEATFTGLTAETNYSFIVTAVNVTGTTSSVASSVLTFLSRPTRPMPTIVLLSDSICSVSWTGGFGALSYSYTLNGEAVTPTIENGLNGQATFTGLSASTTYSLVVAAINSTGPRYSFPLNFTSLPPPPTLPVVTISKVTALGFVARWTGGTGATSYTYTLNGTPATPSIDNGLTGRATFTGLTPNTAYSLVVKARNVTATTLSTATPMTTLTSPTKPTDLSATVTASSFTVSWTGASDVTSYTYLLNGATVTPIDNGTVNQTATFTGLFPLITYTCTVIANNSFGIATSDVLSVRTASTPPQPTSAAVTQLSTALANSNITDPDVAASAITDALATNSAATVVSAALALPSPVIFTALVNNPNLVGATVTVPARAATSLYNGAADPTKIERSLPLYVTIPAADGSLPAPSSGKNTKMAIDVTRNTYTPFVGSTGYGVRVVNGIQHFVSPGKADTVINVGDVLTLITDSGATLNFTVADLDLFVVPYNPPSIVCFLGTAPVLTPTGYIRIDRIQAGDIVITPTGAAMVEAIKKQACKPSSYTNPYVIPEGKFGANRRLLISPRHKVSVDGKMIEARDLGLEQEEQNGTIIYYNLQITKRQNMIVAGVEVESLAALVRVTISNEAFKKILDAKFGGKLTDEIKSKCRFLGYGVSVPAMM
jgi:sugar lactone lactonase YvrE